MTNIIIQSTTTNLKVAVVRKFRTTASDGKEYMMTHYNLDMIIALGYRIRSIIATRFRKWATGRLKEYIKIQI